MPISKQINMKSRPQGMPAEPGDGDVLVQNIYMSVDPCMRGGMRLG